MGLSDSPPTQDQFAEQVTDSIRKAGATADIVYDREQFSLAQADQDGSKLFLANAYKEYCSSPEPMRPQVLQRYVRSWFIGAITLPDSFDDLHPDLLPIVRTRSYFDLAQADTRTSAVLPHQVLGEHLAVGLVYDLPQAMRSLSQDNLDEWGVSFYEALEAARDNLAQLEHAFIGPKQGEGIYLSAARDGYDSSRLILLDLIRRFRVAGDIVAMVPNPDTLIVTGSEDADGLKGMLGLATNALQQPRPISGIAVRLDGDNWVPWLPDPSHPLFTEFHGLQLQSLGQSYGKQKAILDGTTDDDIFVASFYIVQHPKTGHFMTYCVWGKNVLSLLPRTDRIAFMQEGKEPLMAQWDRAVEVMGDLIEPLDMYPERFKVSGFPTDEQLAAMGAESP